MKKQIIQGDLIFLWDEESKFIEEIKIVNVDKNLMVDFNQQYYLTLNEMDICGECKHYGYAMCEHEHSLDTCRDRDSDDTCNIDSFESKNNAN